MDKENRTEWIKIRCKPSTKKKLQEIQKRYNDKYGLKASQADLIHTWISQEHDRLDLVNALRDLDTRIFEWINK